MATEVSQDDIGLLEGQSETGDLYLLGSIKVVAARGRIAVATLLAGPECTRVAPKGCSVGLGSGLDFGMCASPTLKPALKILMILAVPLFFGFTGAALFHYWPRRLPLPVERNLERIAISRGHCTIYLLGRTLVGNVNEFDDGLFAYLMFDYYRSRPAFADRQVMLVSDDRGPSTLYRILVRLPDDLIRGIDELAGLKASGLLSRSSTTGLLTMNSREICSRRRYSVNPMRGPFHDGWRNSMVMNFKVICTGLFVWSRSPTPEYTRTSTLLLQH